MPTPTSTRTTTVTEPPTFTTPTTMSTSNTTVTEPPTTTTRTTTSTPTTTTTQTTTTTLTTTTVTITTVTSTTTTTSTTTEYCLEERVLWEPFNMPGVMSSREDTAEACQRRCAETTGCAHFLWWNLGKTCNLQDVFAVRRPAFPGFISGPPVCGSSLDLAEDADIGHHAYEPTEFACIEPGKVYLAGLGLPSHFVGDRASVVKQCQKRCSDVRGCK